MNNFKNQIFATFKRIQNWFNSPAVIPSTTPRTESERKNILDNQVVRVLKLQNNPQVLLHTDFRAVIKFGRPTNHILHLLLCLPTFGLWLIVWFFIGITNKQNSYTYSVDEFGNIHTSS